MRREEKWKGKQRERVRLIETREIQYLLNEKDEFSDKVEKGKEGEKRKN